MRLAAVTRLAADIHQSEFNQVLALQLGLYVRFLVGEELKNDGEWGRLQP
jgi:hypothetical protein